MSFVVYPEVKRLVKHGSNYTVEVTFSFGPESFSTTVNTAQSDPQKAIEDARQHLYDLGVALAKAVDQAGKLV